MRKPSLRPAPRPFLGGHQCGAVTVAGKLARISQDIPVEGNHDRLVEPVRILTRCTTFFVVGITQVGSKIVIKGMSLRVDWIYTIKTSFRG